MIARFGRLAALAVIALLLAGTGWDAHATLSERDQADVARAEAYINDIGTLKARFFQFTSTGEYAEGAFYIDRPGRMRIEYDPPVPVLIVADGTFLVYNDTELGQVNRVPLLASPASVLLRENLRLEGDGLSVTSVERSASVVQITVAQTDDPLAGSIMLTFSEKPMALRKWTVTDAQGTVTDFALVDPRFGVQLDPALFRFVDDLEDPGKNR